MAGVSPLRAERFEGIEQALEVVPGDDGLAGFLADDRLPVRPR
jgi:hypothetical protein